MRSFLLIIVLIFVFSFSVDAQIYKWIDKNGKVHFSDTPPSTQKSEKKDYHYNTDTGIGSNLKSNENPSSSKHLSNYPTPQHKRKLTKEEKKKSDQLNAAERKHYEDCVKLNAKIRRYKSKAKKAKRKTNSSVDVAGAFRKENALSNKAWNLEEEYRRKCGPGAVWWKDL